MSRHSPEYSLEPLQPERSSRLHEAAKYMLILFMHGRQAMEDRMMDDWAEELDIWESGGTL